MSKLDRRPEQSPVPAAWDYAPAPESREIVELQERYGIFVDGNFAEPRRQNRPHQEYATPSHSDAPRCAQRIRVCQFQRR